MNSTLKCLSTCLVMFLGLANLYGQNHRVKGEVQSSSGEPLIGVSILIKGEGIGAITDDRGKFDLAVNEQSVLIISYVGYKTQELIVGNQTVLNVVLEDDTKLLDELVVVGYGTLRENDLTGAVTSIKSDDIQSLATASLDQAIQGMAAGIQMTQSSGKPGATASIRIRGTTSINGTNEPLYVIDGVPIISDPNEMSTGAVKSGAINPLASISPNDIESIEILKDVSQTAIYGARGANGVILVSTKKGISGKTIVSFDTYYGVQQVAKKISLLNAKQLAELGNEATDNAGLPRKSIFASPISLGEGTDWQDEIFQTAPIQNYQLSVSGGNATTNFSLSGGLFSQEGIIIGSDYTRGNIRLSLNHQLNEKFTVGASFNYMRIESNGVITATGEGGLGGAGVVTSALSYNPALAVFDSEGGYTYEDNLTSSPPGNPVGDAQRNLNKVINNRVIGSVFFDYTIAEGLSFKSSLSGDFYINKELQFIPNDIKRGEQSNGQATHGYINGYTWVWDNVVTYRKKWEDLHRVNVVLGHSMQAFRSDATVVSTSDFDDNRLTYDAIHAGKLKGLAISGSNAWQIQSFFGRINYTHNDRYIFSGTARVDGSSKFGKNNKYGFFPSVAVAWRISQESFFESLPSINELKLRASYGLTGNQGIPAYSSQGRLEITTAYLNNQSPITGSGLISLSNQDLKWEKTTQANIGLDMGLLEDRIQITADFYQKNTSDLLLNTPIPYYSGFKAAYMNVGDLENKGVEFSLSSFIINEKNFKWDLNFNISKNVNKVTDLGELGIDGIPSEPMLGIAGWSRILEGESVGIFYGYVADGIFQLNEPLDDAPYFKGDTPKAGDRKYKDLDVNGVIDEHDITEIGNANPDFTFGLTNTVTCKNFSFRIFLQGSVGNEVANFNTFNLENFSGTTNASTTALKRWTPNNPTNEYPKADAAPPINVLSSAQVEDGAYLRIKNIRLGYNFGQNICKKMGIAQFHVYASVQNLHTFTAYSGYDPEVSMFRNVSSLGADYGSYPTSRTILLGINLQF